MNINVSIIHDIRNKHTKQTKSSYVKTNIETCISTSTKKNNLFKRARIMLLLLRRHLATLQVLLFMCKRCTLTLHLLFTVFQLRQLRR